MTNADFERGWIILQRLLVVTTFVVSTIIMWKVW